ncbi:MAG: helix-turn-helix domain-containing protein [Burkholderiales bacterium]
MRVASTIELSEAEREKLLRLAQSNRVEVRLARRASIVLLAAEGWDNQEIGAARGVGRIQVGRWRERYVFGGLQAIEKDLPALAAQR